MRGRWMIGVVLAGSLAGCATLSPEQCMSADWFSLGAQDALNGYPPNHVDRHARACGKAGVVPDERTWWAGYVETLPRFCVGGTGYSYGARNATYYGQCPDELEYAFLDGYRLGQDYYDLKRRIDEAEKEIRRLRESMNDDDATDASREADGRWLDHYKRERDRLQRQQWDLESRARERGYPTVY